MVSYSLNFEFQESTKTFLCGGAKIYGPLYYNYTGGSNTLHTLLVKHYNDYLDRRSCRRGRGVFINRALHKKSFLCNTQFLSIFSRAPCRDIFSKIGIGNVRGVTKNVPNFQVYEPTPATPTTPSIKVVIVVLY